MFKKLAQSIVIRHIVKLAKPEELTTPLDQHEASIGRDSMVRPTKENVERNTKHLDNLAKGQLEGSKMAINVLSNTAPKAPKYVHKANTLATAHDAYSNIHSAAAAINAKNSNKAANSPAKTQTPSSSTAATNGLSELKKGLTDPNAWMP
jgi:hypothetical protein